MNSAVLTMDRESKRTAKQNERDLPFVVELRQPPAGFENVLKVILLFHDELGIEERCGTSRKVKKSCEPSVEYRRWCFAESKHASHFQAIFGGTYVDAEPKTGKK